MDFSLHQRIMLLIKATRALLSSSWRISDQIWRDKLDEAETLMKIGKGHEAVHILEEINNGWLAKQTQ